MKWTRTRSVMAAIGLAWATPAPVAAQSPESIDPIEGADFGKGVLLGPRAMAQTCVSFDRSNIPKLAPPTQKVASYRAVRTTSELRKNLGFNFAAGAGVDIKAAKFEVSSQLTMLNESLISSDSQTLEMYVVAVGNTRYLQAPVLDSRWQTDLLKPGGLQAFQRACGDMFVAGIQASHEMHGIATLEDSAASAVQEKSKGFSTSGQVTVASWDLLVEIDEKLASTSSTQRVKVFLDSTDIDYNQPEDISTLTATYREFRPRGNGRVKRLYVQPYTTVQGWPKSEDFAQVQLVGEDVIAPLIDGSWDIQAYVSQIGGIEGGVRAVAMGKGKTRDAWLAHLSGVKKNLERLRDVMGSAHDWCQSFARVRGQLEPRCKVLADWWKQQNAGARLAEIVPRPGLACGIEALLADGGGAAWTSNVPSSVPAEGESLAPKPISRLAPADFWQLLPKQQQWDTYDGSDSQLGESNDWEINLSVDAYTKDDIKFRVAETIREVPKMQFKNYKTKLRHTDVLQLRPSSGCFFADQVTDDTPGEGSKLTAVPIGALERHTATLRQGKNPIVLQDAKYFSSVQCSLASQTPASCAFTFTKKLPIPVVTHAAQYRARARLERATQALAELKIPIWISEMEKVAKLPKPAPLPVMSDAEKAQMRASTAKNSQSAAAGAAAAAKAMQELEARQRAAAAAGAAAGAAAKAAGARANEKK